MSYSFEQGPDNVVTIKVIGVGGKPEKGKEAAEASLDAIQPLFEDDTEMVFVTCGMGGGTGTGAAPVISFI